MKKTMLYTQSRETAIQSGEVAIWKESHHANIACAKAIEEEIAAHFDGMHLDKDAAKNVIDRFGFDRVNWVLMTTVQQKDYDGRFRQEHKEWAKDAFSHYVRDEMRQYLVESHPAVLDGLIAQTRRAWQELRLYDHTHCIPDTSQQNYIGKVLVLGPAVLLDEHKRPQDQLFLCSGGFGAAAGACGRKVYGQFLSDGEQCQFWRQDFIGVIQEEHLPEWAQEKIQQIGSIEQEMDGDSMKILNRLKEMTRMIEESTGSQQQIQVSPTGNIVVHTSRDAVTELQIEQQPDPQGGKVTLTFRGCIRGTADRMNAGEFQQAFGEIQEMNNLLYELEQSKITVNPIELNQWADWLDDRQQEQTIVPVHEQEQGPSMTMEMY